MKKNTLLSPGSIDHRCIIKGSGSEYKFLYKQLSIPLFLVVMLFFVFTSKGQITRNDAKLAMQCYNNKFFYQYGTYGSSYKAMYYANTDRTTRADFWREVESIETLIDAYNINNDNDFKNKIRYLYNGIRDGYGLTWSNNSYNDDLIWGSLMCIRAYFIFNDGGMKDMAINNFNIVWSRAWDNTLGGGLYWTTSRTSKNTCVNAPAAICAMFLYYATGDASYKNKAKMIMDWTRSRLYDANTGEVKGAIDLSGNITEGSRTYTQGTFIGACGELQKYYPSEGWQAIGKKAMDYAKNNISNSQGLLPDEYCGSDDCPGFKGIFARWVCKFVKDFNYAGTYGSWLNYNANQAWAYRNSQGLMWAQWWRRTPDGYLTSWETTSGISMMNCVFLFNGATASARITEDDTPEITNDKNTFTLYPNPGNGRVILLQNDQMAKVKNIFIVNSQGKLMSQKVMEKGDNLELNVTGWPKGIYTIKVQTINSMISKQLIVH